MKTTVASRILPGQKGIRVLRPAAVTNFTGGSRLRQGWNVLGLAENRVVATPLTYPTVTAVAQLLFIVGGHVLGVVVAHDRAVALLRPEAMRRAQLPLLSVMVVYTVGGLLLLFSP